MQHKAKKFSTRAKAVTSAAAVAVIGVGVFGAVSASADTQAAPALAPAALKAKTTTTSNHLTVDAATDAARAALEAAEREGQRVTVAVVDRNGNTVVTLRGDGAGPQSYESAQRKAFTAAAWNAPTSQLAERLQQTSNLKDIPGPCSWRAASLSPPTTRRSPASASRALRPGHWTRSSRRRG